MKHEAIYKIGQTRKETKEHRGSHLVCVGDDLFVRPSELPGGVAYVTETYKLAYRYPSIRQDPCWVIDKVELDEERSLGAPPPEPESPSLSWWQRLLNLILRREPIPAARLLKDGK